MYNVTSGLATLDGNALEVLELLENRILRWAAGCGAARYSFPPLLRVADLVRFDYFQNFPHLALIATGLRPDVIEREYAGGANVATIAAEHLTTGSYALPSAACYNVYLHWMNARLPEARYATTVARCFRNEVEYVGLKRLWGFTMREIVCLGRQEVAQEHLAAFKVKIQSFAGAIGLPLTIQTASDPFYDKKSSRAAMQTLFPVKEEFVYGDSVAIASVNFHRNFFGERCDIRLDDDTHAFTSCVAFGLERWLHALAEHFKNDSRAIVAALSSAD